MPEWTPLRTAGRGPMEGRRGPAIRGAGHVPPRGRVGGDTNGPHEARAEVAVVHGVDMDAHAKVIRAYHLAATNVDRHMGEPGVERVGEEQHVPGLHSCGSNMGIAVGQHPEVLRRVIPELAVDPMHEARAAKARGGRVADVGVAIPHVRERHADDARAHEGGRRGRGDLRGAGVEDRGGACDGERTGERETDERLCQEMVLPVTVTSFSMPPCVWSSYLAPPMARLCLPGPQRGWRGHTARPFGPDLSRRGYYVW